MFKLPARNVELKERLLYEQTYTPPRLQAQTQIYRKAFPVKSTLSVSLDIYL